LSAACLWSAWGRVERPAAGEGLVAGGSSWSRLNWAVRADGVGILALLEGWIDRLGSWLSGVSEMVWAR
jgi:hypothetical protein